MSNSVASATPLKEILEALDSIEDLAGSAASGQSIRASVSVVRLGLSGLDRQIAELLDLSRLDLQAQLAQAPPASIDDAEPAPIDAEKLRAQVTKEVGQLVLSLLERRQSELYAEAGSESRTAHAHQLDTAAAAILRLRRDVARALSEMHDPKSSKPACDRIER